MSKKTFFKRIALVAVAALGFGMLSVAPSNATVTSHTLTIDSATDSIDLGETATAVLTHQFVNLASQWDSVTIVGVVTSSNAIDAGNIAMRVTDSYTSIANDASGANSPQYMQLPNNNDGETRTLVHSGGNLSNTNRADRLSDSLTVGYIGSANRSVGSQISVDLYNPAKAGTYVISFYTLTSDGGSSTLVSSTVGATWTVTVSATAATAATSASTVTLRNGDAAARGGQGTYFNGTGEGTDSQTLAARSTSTTSTTPGFSLVIKQKDDLTSDLGNLAQESYTVQVSGEAWVTAGTTTGGVAVAAATRPTSATGVKWIQMATHVADSATVVRVWSTGTAGTATLTVTSAAGLVLGTKTVTFHGDVTALAVTTTTKKVIQAGTSTASSAAFSVTATDAGGRAVTGLTPTIISSNANAISGGSCTDASSSAVTDGVYSCSVTPVSTSTSGMAATLTVRVGDPADATGTTYLTTTYAVTMGGAISTFVLTTDKATYAAGEAMVVTATAKDASGNTPYDGQAGPTLRANKALGGTAAGTSITMNAFYDGVSTSQTRSASVRTMSNDITLFAPAASGEFTISGLDGQTTPASVSVKATVVDDAATSAANAASDAALEAIDAANAATDAANLAAEAADAATVAAEEARDAADAATAAVEALATEVATLMAALKAQITTLANTVAKIAKKVKA